MHLDYLTLAAICEALEERLVGARVQSVVQPSPEALVLELYTGERQYLYLSSEPQDPAVGLLAKPLRRGVAQPTPLLLLLRKHVRGARLVELQQPELERVLRLTFARADGRVTLVCELMGRLSNLILLDEDDMVMDAARRVPSSVNRYRVVLPQRAYVPPPPQQRHAPAAVTAQMLLEAANQAPEMPLDRLLIGMVAGMSPVLAREIVHRAQVSADGHPLRLAQATNLLQRMGELYALPETGGWEPSIAFKGTSDRRRPEMALPYAPTHREDWEPREGILAATEEVLRARGALDAYAQVRTRLHGIIARARERLERRLNKLNAELEARPGDALLLAKGNALLALQHSIRPRQESLLVPPDLAEGLTGEACDAPLEIRLDPSLSPVANAQRYFSRHRKLQAASERIPPLVRQVELELSYLEQADAEVEMAASRPELDEIAAALQEAGYLRRRPASRHASPASELLRLNATDGGLILVGRNSRQNALITFRLGRPDDIWLHAHGVGGAHVIYRPTGAEPDPASLQAAAGLAAYHSAARDQSQVQVDYTQRKHVKAIRGAGPGMVTYRQESTLVVEPLSPTEYAEGSDHAGA